MSTRPGGFPLMVPCTLYDETVTAYPTTVPGLVVHEAIRGNGWTLTHRASGGVIDTADTEQEARLLAERYGPCGDWHRSGAAIYADAEMLARARALRDARGRYAPTGLPNLREARPMMFAREPAEAPHA